MNFYILPNSHYVLLLLTLIKLIFWISAFFSTEKICTFVLQSFCLCLVLWKITPMCAWYSFSSPSHQPFCFITQPLCIFTPSWNLKLVPYHLNLVFCTKVLCKLAFFLYFISKEKFTFFVSSSTVFRRLAWSLTVFSWLSINSFVAFYTFCLPWSYLGYPLWNLNVPSVSEFL